MVGRCFFWRGLGLFSGAMLVFRGVWVFHFIEIACRVNDGQETNHKCAMSNLERYGFSLDHHRNWSSENHRPGNWMVILQVANPQSTSRFVWLALSRFWWTVPLPQPLAKVNHSGEQSSGSFFEFWILPKSTSPRTDPGFQSTFATSDHRCTRCQPICYVSRPSEKTWGVTGGWMAFSELGGYQPTTNSPPPPPAPPARL